MDQAMGMLDFFVLEAGEYLDRLDALAQTPAGPFPDAEEFVRIARAFRGSALMASQQPMARAAQGLETAGRAARDGRLAWDERVRGEMVRAVDDCKVLLRRIRNPATEDAAQGEALGASLERLAGRSSVPPRAESAGLDAGGRAFIAREAAAIASILDRIARTLAADPAGRQALGGVAPAMSALRGVAVLSDLPPLPDVLAGIEGAVKETSATSGAVSPAVPAAFDAGARALARAAREVVDLGRPAPDSEEARDFASRLLAAFARTGDIRPIETLFYDDAGPHVVRQGEAPTPLSPVEMVSQGEFLAAAAHDLNRAPTPIERDLRLFGVAATLRPLAGSGGSPLADSLGRLADAGRGAIERGSAAGDLDAFVGVITEAADVLRSAESGDQAALAARLDAASAGLLTLGTPRGMPAAAEVLVPEAPVPEAFAPAPPTTPAVPEAPEPVEAAGAASGLAESYEALERLLAGPGAPVSSLDDLLGAPTAAPLAAAAPSRAEPDLAAPQEGVVPIESLAPRDEALVPGPAPEAEIVPIESLLYGGAGALERALALMPELEALLAGLDGSSPRLKDVLREVFDLVELGLGSRR